MNMKTRMAQEKIIVDSAANPRRVHSSLRRNLIQTATDIIECHLEQLHCEILTQAIIDLSPAEVFAPAEFWLPKKPAKKARAATDADAGRWPL